MGQGYIYHRQEWLDPSHLSSFPACCEDRILLALPQLDRNDSLVQRCSWLYFSSLFSPLSSNFPTASLYWIYRNIFPSKEEKRELQGKSQEVVGENTRLKTNGNKFFSKSLRELKFSFSHLGWDRSQEVFGEFSPCIPEFHSVLHEKLCVPSYNCWIY